jgi:Holliday junction resolvasome RuvABC endonuclease subunit
VIVIGCDPGFGVRNVTGWAVVDTANDTVLARGTLKATGDGDDARLASLVSPLREVIDQAHFLQHVELCAYELPVHGPNQRTIAGLARVCGLILACATLAALPCVSVQPASAKLALTGKGNADKRAMIAAAWQQFGLHGALTDAEADAIGIALAGAAQWMEAHL